MNRTASLLLRISTDVLNLVIFTYFYFDVVEGDVKLDFYLIGLIFLILLTAFRITRELTYDVQSIFIKYNHPLLFGLCLIPYSYFYFFSKMDFLQDGILRMFLLASIGAAVIFFLLFHFVFRYFEFNFTKGTLTGFNLGKKIKKDDLQIDVKPDVIKVTYKNKDYHYDKSAFPSKDWELLTSSFTRFAKM